MSANDTPLFASGSYELMTNVETVSQFGSDAAHPPAPLPLSLPRSLTVPETSILDDVAGASAVLKYARVVAVGCPPGMLAYVQVKLVFDALAVQFAGKSTNWEVVLAHCAAPQKSLSEATILGFVSVVPPVLVMLNSTHV